MQIIFRATVTIVLCLFLASCSSKELEQTQHEALTKASSTIEQASQQAQNLLSSQEAIKKFIEKLNSLIETINSQEGQIFIDSFIAFIPEIESTGIKIDNIYLDSIPFLLIFEVKLEQVDRHKLDELISKETRSEPQLLSVLELLRTLVNTAQAQKLGSFNMDRVQLRVSPYPPFASTRIKYMRSNK
jgi:hypothetical protein